VIPPTIEWRGDHIALIDQRVLPNELVIVSAATVDELCGYIATLAVRGAPALGAAGAMGVALAHVRGEPLAAAAAQLVATRPTAANLAWGARRALSAADPIAEALAVAADDVARCRAIGRHGAALLADGARVLTHCNTGSLACVEWGTALGVVRAAHEAGTRVHLWVDETRPLLQGARLTAWECTQLGIPHTLVPDVRAASLMAEGRVDRVLLGADRIAANGDVANKVGTYSLAVLAAHHGIPFHVVAPRSTFDADTPTGREIVIEQRGPEEVTSFGGARVAPEGVVVDNAAFDVTPAALISSYITEDGIEPGARASSRTERTNRRAPPA
jgi:S-methyl-5-thioribose-1-phosphate isomerase